MVSIFTDMVGSIDMLKLHYFIKSKYLCKHAIIKLEKRIGNYLQLLHMQHLSVTILK